LFTATERGLEKAIESFFFPAFSSRPFFQLFFSFTTVLTGMS
jgi:hypothetical protein